MRISKEYGGLVCVACGSELDFSIGYTGIRKAYPFEVALDCPKCGRHYYICNCKSDMDVCHVYAFPPFEEV